MTHPIVDQLPKGVHCACGLFSRYPAYVYAHWDIVLVFTCPHCKREYEIIGGTATEKGNGRSTQDE